MDQNTLGKLGEVNDSLVEHLRWLLEKRDLDALAKLIPVVDKLTTALIKIHAIEAHGHGTTVPELSSIGG